MTPMLPGAPPVSAAPNPAPVPHARPTLITGERGEVRVPPDVCDLDSFTRWCHSDDFPEHVRICYLAGVLWIDLNMEQAFSHNDVKGEVAGVLRALTKAGGLGRYFG